MKGSEIRPCDGCAGALLAGHVGNFYVVESSMAMVNHRAMQQTEGLAIMFGGSLRLAEAMSPNPEIITVPGDEQPVLKTKLLLCFECYCTKPLAELQEAVNSRAKDAEVPA